MSPDLPKPQSSTRPLGNVVESCSAEKDDTSKPDKPWSIDCILDILCNGDAEDKQVVNKLPRLTVISREPKQVHYKKFEGGKWVDGGFTSAGSASGTTVKINKDQGCREATSTLYHEVRHTDQPATMGDAEREYDAYTKEEKWRIKKGYPEGGENFRKKITDPRDPSKTIEVPDEDAIKADVDANYAYNPPAPLGGGPAPPQVKGLTPDGKQVKLADGTTRPPKEGDAYRLPDTGGKDLGTIDPKKWKCR
jgi:hypothetical protein